MRCTTVDGAEEEAQTIYRHNIARLRKGFCTKSYIFDEFRYQETSHNHQHPDMDRTRLVQWPKVLVVELNIKRVRSV